MRSLQRWTLLLVFGLLFFSCGSEEKASTSEAIRFSDLYSGSTAPFRSCSSCHVPGGDVYINGVLLDFSTEELAYSTLTTQSSVSPSDPVNCVDIPYVTTKAADSYLALVLDDNLNAAGIASKPDCRPYSIHLDDLNLSTAEKTSVVNWINQGAIK